MNVITGSYTLPPSPPTPPRKDVGVREFFEKLGYSVTFDYSRRLRESWWELYDDDEKLVCQIDQFVPLDVIVQDFIQFHLDKDPDSNVDYKINAPNTDTSKKLFRKVYEFKTYNILPNGQLLMSL